MPCSLPGKRWKLEDIPKLAMRRTRRSLRLSAEVNTDPKHLYAWHNSYRLIEKGILMTAIFGSGPFRRANCIFGLGLERVSILGARTSKYGTMTKPSHVKSPIWNQP